MVFTPVAFAGICLRSSFGRAYAVDGNKNALIANAATTKARDMADQREPTFTKKTSKEKSWQENKNQRGETGDYERAL